MTSHKPIIVVHGGAGDWPTSLHKEALVGVRKAADLGFNALLNAGSALDAVETAVVSMEDNPTFNAGTGSALNLLGEIETDAAIMDGRNLRGGGVAVLRGIRNPIRAARIVMEKTGHVLVAGNAARRLALEYGLAQADLRVPRRVRAWKMGLRELRRKKDRDSRNKLLIHQVFSRKPLDTVGALALDQKGDLAVADSAGGMSLKLPGRVGDSPILGAGLYADNRSGAATATGVGEQAMRLVISKMACDLMRRETGPSAARSTIRLATGTFGPGTGLLTLDRKGRFGVAHNTRHLCWALKTVDKSAEQMRGTRLRK